MHFEHWEPNAIEAESMRRLRAELAALRGPDWPQYSALEESFVERVIHTTADFEFGRLLYFSPGAAEAGQAALRAGALIVTDTNMAASGISKVSLAKLGAELHCFMADPELAKEAKAQGVTRSRLCMERGAELAKSTGRPLIYVIGNAPTALERIWELVEAGEVEPALVIAAPVGFVNVLEGKALIKGLACPKIIVEGRKGGSTIAAALTNALLYSVYREAY